MQSFSRDLCFRACQPALPTAALLLSSSWGFFSPKRCRVEAPAPRTGQALGFAPSCASPRWFGFSLGSEPVGTFLAMDRENTKGRSLPAVSAFSSHGFAQGWSSRGGRCGWRVGGGAWARRHSRGRAAASSTRGCARREHDPKGWGTTDRTGGHWGSCPLLPSSLRASCHRGPAVPGSSWPRAC